MEEEEDKGFFKSTVEDGSILKSRGELGLDWRVNPRESSSSWSFERPKKTEGLH